MPLEFSWDPNKAASNLEKHGVFLRGGVDGFRRPPLHYGERSRSLRGRTQVRSRGADIYRETGGRRARRARR